MKKIFFLFIVLLTFFSCEKQECHPDSIFLTGFLLVDSELPGSCGWEKIYECSMYVTTPPYKIVPVLLYTDKEHAINSKLEYIQYNEILTEYFY
jgi:hypothetical protein